jgi:hypothetical protein
MTLAGVETLPASLPRAALSHRTKARHRLLQAAVALLVLASLILAARPSHSLHNTPLNRGRFLFIVGL